VFTAAAAIGLAVQAFRDHSHAAASHNQRQQGLPRTYRSAHPLDFVLAAAAFLSMQAFSDPSRAAMMRGQRTLEINPDHPLIAGLKDKVAVLLLMLCLRSSVKQLMELVVERECGQSSQMTQCMHVLC
jgi:HSP90 family molecular chaperone